ncbi:MAG: sulfotransferase [Acidimicrobiales bacterium]
MARTIDRVRQEGADQLKAMVPLSARRGLNRGRLAARQATAGRRTLPDFMIIGGQRCGTSSLFKWLSRHPELIPALRKEVDYFSLDHQQGEAWYRAHFPLAGRRRWAERRSHPWATYEATPTYLFDPRAPDRARALLPDAKLIVLLRHPAERAISHYHHNVRHGLEPLDLAEALAAENDRLAPEWAQIRADPDHRAITLRRFSYVARGRYAEQLQRWQASFPIEQFLVMRSEDLFGSPRRALDEICDFVGVSRWYPPEFRNYSYVGSPDNSYQAPSVAIGRVLDEALQEPNEALREMLGPAFTWPGPT